MLIRKCAASFIYFLAQVIACTALILAFLGPVPSWAYTNQWEWKAVGIFKGSTAVATGPSTSFNTKQEALAALRALAPPTGEALTIEAGITSMGSSFIRYKYVMPSPTPTYTAWHYDTMDPATWLNSEEEWVAKEEAYWSNFCSRPIQIEPDGEWRTTGPGVPGTDEYWSTGLTFQTRPYVAHVEGCTFPNPMPLAAFRWLEQSCPQPGLGFIPDQCATPLTVGYIDGHPLECPANGVPFQVGNPCDVATGDKSQSETDYSSIGLTFSRYYHSANLESAQGLGFGWTHNYATRLIFNAGGSTPLGVLRPNGHHDILQLSSGRYVSRSGDGLQVEIINSKWTASLSDGSREVYDSSGRLEQLIDKTGQITNLAYKRGVLASVTGPFGHALQFSYDAGRISEITDPAGQAIAFDYDSNANLVQVSYPDGTSRIYEYENTNFPHHLTGIVDENGVQYGSYSYDTMGRVTTSEHAGGAGLVSLVYNSGSTVVTDSAGAETTYSFDSLATHTRRITGTSKNGLSTAYSLQSLNDDFQRRVTQTIDPRGVITKYTYDVDHLTSLIEGFGTSNQRTTTYQYLSTQDDLVTYEGLSSTASGTLREVLTSYNAQRLPETVTYRGYEGSTYTDRITTLSYDTAGRLTGIDGPRTDVSDTTGFTYYTCTTGDECGQLHTVTNALGHVTTYLTYNAHGQPLTMTDPNGILTTLTYDLRQRLTSRTVGGETMTFEYWPTGLLKKVILPDASFLLYTYDAAHRLTRIDDAEGNHVVYTLDAMGNRTAENTYDSGNAMKLTQARTYNTLNQLWKETGAAGTAAVTTTFGYDDIGNQTTINAPLSRNTAQLYDELNRLKQVTDPANGVAQYGYDANDNLTSVTDPRSKITTYQYSGFGDLEQLTSPDTGTTTNDFDSAGNLSTHTDARGKTATYSYDALNRLTQRAYPDQTLGFAYDSGTYGKGHLTAAADANHSLAWSYNAQGRVIGKGQTIGSITQSVGYGYANGNLTSIVTPSGQTITYGHSQGRIRSISVNGSALLTNVLYTPFGLPRNWRWGNGTFTTREYDTDGRLSAFDSAGRSTFTFYPDNSIKSRHDDTPSTFSVVTGTATFAVASTSNRLSNISGALTRTYSYDAAGNITGDGTRTFTYNDSGRMSSATSGGTTTVYTLNALGQRVKKSNTTGTTYYVYDEAGHLTGEYDGAGNLIQELVWLGDIPVASLRPNGSGISVLYVHTDHLNAPTKLTRSTDNVIVWRWDHDAFGNGVPNQDPDGNGSAVAFNLRYPGQYYDSETGLTYNFYRDYDSQVGRYVQSDPIGLQGGINTYSYVGANPVSLVDPYGLLVECTDWKRGFDVRTFSAMTTRRILIREFDSIGGNPTGPEFGPGIDPDRGRRPRIMPGPQMGVDIYWVHTEVWRVQPYEQFWDVVPYWRVCAETFDVCGDIETRSWEEYDRRTVWRRDLDRDVGKSYLELVTRRSGGGHMSVP